MNPPDYRYSKEHEWVHEDGADHVKIGVTDFAQEQLGDIVFVELPDVGVEVEQGQPFGSIEAVKTVSDLFSPVTGEVVEVNDAVRDDPSVVNSSAYEGGWMIRVRMTDATQLQDLLTAEAYASFVQGLESGEG